MYDLSYLSLISAYRQTEKEGMYLFNGTVWQPRHLSFRDIFWAYVFLGVTRFLTRKRKLLAARKKNGTCVI